MQCVIYPHAKSLLYFFLVFCFLILLLENHYDRGKAIYKDKFNIFAFSDAFSDAYTLMPFFFLPKECILKVQYLSVSSKKVLLIINMAYLVYYPSLLFQDTFVAMKL